MTHPYDFEVLLLVPLTVAFGFLTWVMWSLTRDLTPRRRVYRFSTRKLRTSSNGFPAERN
jgi:hypothetical protein